MPIDGITPTPNVKIRVADPTNEADINLIKFTALDFFNPEWNEYNPPKDEFLRKAFLDEGRLDNKQWENFNDPAKPPFEKALADYYLNRRKAYTMIANVKEEAIGMAVVEVAPPDQIQFFKPSGYDLYDNAGARIHKVNFYKNFQGKGHGKILMNKIMESLSNGALTGSIIATAALGVNLVNHSARRLYLGQGFKEQVAVFRPDERGKEKLRKQNISLSQLSSGSPDGLIELGHDNNCGARKTLSECKLLVEFDDERLRPFNFTLNVPGRAEILALWCA